jgi:hypothetical protein
MTTESKQYPEYAAFTKTYEQLPDQDKQLLERSFQQLNNFLERPKLVEFARYVRQIGDKIGIGPQGRS